MLENMPQNIKSAYIISIFTMIFFPLLGIFFNCIELYFGYLVGAIISTININLLINGVEKILFFQDKPIFCLGMFIVGKISQKYFPNHVLTNILGTGIGVLNFKFSYLLYHFGKKFFSKNKE